MAHKQKSDECDLCGKTIEGELVFLRGVSCYAGDRFALPEIDLKLQRLCAEPRPQIKQSLQAVVAE